MLSLCAVFEDWLLEDGTYPPLEKGQKVNLSFWIDLNEIKIEENNIYEFEQIKYSEYNFCGKIIYKHPNHIIFDAGYFKFYTEKKDIVNISVGQFIKGNGILKVNPYIDWTEVLDKNKNRPDIFYNLIIDKIFELKTPEKYITRKGGSESGPSSLPINEYINVDKKEVIKTDSEGEFISYLLTLNFPST